MSSVLGTKHRVNIGPLVLGACANRLSRSLRHGATMALVTFPPPWGKASLTHSLKTASMSAGVKSPGTAWPRHATSYLQPGHWYEAYCRGADDAASTYTLGTEL